MKRKHVFGAFFSCSFSCNEIGTMRRMRMKSGTANLCADLCADLPCAYPHRAHLPRAHLPRTHLLCAHIPRASFLKLIFLVPTFLVPIFLVPIFFVQIVIIIAIPSLTTPCKGGGDNDFVTIQPGDTEHFL